VGEALPNGLGRRVYYTKDRLTVNQPGRLGAALACAVSTQAPVKRHGKRREECPAEGQSEAPAEALGKALNKASLEAPDLRLGKPRADGPDLGPAKAKAVAPGQEPAEPNHEPTNQERPFGPQECLGEPWREPPTEGGV